MRLKQKKIYLMIMLGLFLLVSGCGSQTDEKAAAVQQEPVNGTVPEKETASAENSETSNLRGKKILIAYFSHTKHTQQFAQIIQQNTGGDLFEIEPKNPYPTDYDTVVAQAKQEVNSGYTPELKQDIDTNYYDVIFIGTPVWWYTFAPPIRTFLTQHDLSGKVIIPFTTHKGSGLSGIDNKIKELQPDADILAGLAVWDDTAPKESDNIKKWLQGLNF
ncbi:flavodoxin [Pectinatus haikarae]|uniref:Flavodoxin n=2 Tax=Pectinatus haikarae TaxID=349096 RepID=A0ABT9Y9D6_9FIRM|nr:flavodoxin [Pectinatus haikarae]MDQ0204422.1 flavodoxin [Pectinatus haikarae]